MTILLMEVGWKICDVGDGTKPFLLKTLFTVENKATAIGRIRTTEIEPSDFEALKLSGFIHEASKIGTVRLYELG